MDAEKEKVREAEDSGASVRGGLDAEWDRERERERKMTQSEFALPPYRKP